VGPQAPVVPHEFWGWVMQLFEQQYPPLHTLLWQEEDEVQAAPGPETQLPEPLQVLLPPQEIPDTTGAHTPFCWPVSAALQASQEFPLQVELQHTPLTQLPVPHCEAAVQACPCPRSATQIPALQYWLGEHCAFDVQDELGVTQAPELQVWPDWQTLPQAPQLVGSERRFEQTVPH